MPRPTRYPFAFAIIAFLAARVLAAGSLSGRILDAGLQPVAGARVEWFAFRPTERVLLDDSRGDAAAVLGSVRTDGDGRFTTAFEKATGEISIRILLSQGCEIDAFGPFDPGTQEELDDLILPAVGSKVWGQVVDDAGRAVSGARVVLQAARRSVEGRMLWKTLAGADGAFRFPEVPLVPMSVTVRASGFAVSHADVSFGAGSTRVVLHTGSQVSGIVVDNAGQPVAGAIVVAGLNAVETNREGRYRLDVRAGLVSLLAIDSNRRIGKRGILIIRADVDSDLEPLRVAPSACVAGSVIDESSRRPVAGARITAARVHIGPDPDPLEWRAALADGRGRFLICGLAAGAHRLEVEHEGSLPAEVDNALALVAPDERSVLLHRELVVSGRVVDESGAPVAAARVHMSAESKTAETVTRKDGHFRLGRLAPAPNLQLGAEKVGFVPARLYGLALKAGAPTLVPDLVLRRGLRAFGKIVDPSGNPVAGVEVRAAPEAEKRKLDVSFGEPPPPPDTLSDGEGRFELTGLAPGICRVILWREGFADRTVTGLSVRKEGPNEWTPIVLTLGAAIDGRVINGDGKSIEGAQVSAFFQQGRTKWATSDERGRFHLEDLPGQPPIELWVSAEGYVSARARRVTPPAADVTLSLVTAAKLAGRVEDAETKESVAAFSLRLVSASDLENPQSSEDFRSDEGHFVLGNVAPGRWSIRVLAPGYPPATFPVGEVTEGETRESLVFQIRKGLSLSGRVLDSRGKGVAEAHLVARPHETAGNSAASFFDDPETSTDVEGRFRLEGLPSGATTVEVSHPAFLTATREVDPEIQASVDVVLESGSRIAGRFFSSATRTPLEGEEVQLRGSARDTARTDAAGNFVFENLADGSYRISATGAKPLEVSIVEGRSVDDLILDRVGGAEVRGTVAGLPPSRLGLLRVVAMTEDFNYQAETATDEQGHFALRDVPAGSVRFMASTQGMPVQNVRRIIEIPEGGAEVSVELIFQGSSCASGRVTRAGRPVAEAFVMVKAEPVGPESFRAITFTDGRGFYELEGLANGDYQVSLGLILTPAFRSLRVDGDTTADFELPSGSLRGHVREAVTGVPLSGAQVRVDAGADPSSTRTTATDVEGGFEVIDLEAGTYSVKVIKEGFEEASISVSVGAEPADVAVGLSRSGITR